VRGLERRGKPTQARQRTERLVHSFLTIRYPHPVIAAGRVLDRRLEAFASVW